MKAQGGEIKRCVSLHAADEIAPATGFVRYVRNTDGTEVINGPYCDGCQASHCRALRHRESLREIREVGAIPLDYRERLVEAQREGIKRRIREEIERHPGTDAEIAENVTSALLSLPYRAPFIGVPSVVLDLLQRWSAEQDEASATMLAEVDPEEVF